MPSDLDKLMALLKIAHHGVYREARTELAVNGFNYLKTQESLSNKQYMSTILLWKFFSIIRVFYRVLSDFSPSVVREFRRIYFRVRLFSDIMAMFDNLYMNISTHIIEKKCARLFKRSHKQ